MKTSIGHVVLRVRNVARSSQWYQDVLGVAVTAEIPGRMVFLSADDDSSHELALMQIGQDAPGPDPHRVGLYHVGWRVKSLDNLKGLKTRLEKLGARIAGVGDHGISYGLYVFDPDGNELEIYYELPRSEWPGGDMLFAGSFPNPIDLD